MDRPTKEQIQQARTLLLNELGGEELAATMGAPVFDAVSVLLAATAEPADEELVVEVERAKVEYPGADDAYSFEQGYRAGACREGAR